MKHMMLETSYSIEKWDVDHPRYGDFLDCVKAAAPEQMGFLQHSYFQNYPCYLLAALQDQQVVGFLQFAAMPIGAEFKCPTLTLDGQTLVEAKIHGFAVHPAFRNRGIGTSLQRGAIEWARQLGCYQLASQSSYDREANYHVKLSLGFAVQPERHGDNEYAVYFIMPLKPISDHGENA
jgi:GNAT superfamily N-acetyltransferase